MSTFSFRAGWFRGARKVWHCLAFHLVADDTKRTMKFTVGIPWFLTVMVEVPLIPIWLGGNILTGGAGERAEYGLWHDYYEFKLQLKRIIDLSGQRAGWEYRRVHSHGEATITKVDRLISNLVYDDPYTQLWVEDQKIDRWAFEMSSWYVPSKHWSTPDLYDHVFTLKASQEDGKMKEVWIKQKISKRLMPAQVFHCLTRKLSFD
jgi:hypothetical protein